MGAPLLSMKRLFEPLARRCTILTWDMRGFFASGIPEDPEAYTIDHHLEDMEAVIEAFGAKTFILGGWSMGVQLSLESVHRNPDRVRALLLVSGPYQRALEAVLPGLHPYFARGLERAYDFGPVVTRMVDRALRPKWLPRSLARVGLLARDPELFERVIERFREVDWGRYLTVVRYLHEHNAEPYLSKIKTPTLVACGTRDLLTPLAVAKRMHARIEGAELFVIPRATHYIVVEYGELVASRIDRFLDKVRV
jgi:pimeloyl-ACP methyl ester carboxylesterase